MTWGAISLSSRSRCRCLVAHPLYLSISSLRPSISTHPLISISFSIYLSLSLCLSLFLSPSLSLIEFESMNDFILIFVSLRFYVEIFYNKICLEAKKMWGTSKKLAFSKLYNFQNATKHLKIFPKMFLPENILHSENNLHVATS